MIDQLIPLSPSPLPLGPMIWKLSRAPFPDDGRPPREISILRNIDVNSGPFFLHTPNRLIFDSCLSRNSPSSSFKFLATNNWTESFRRETRRGERSSTGWWIERRSWKYNIFRAGCLILVTLRERKSGSRIPWKYWPLKLNPANASSIRAT